MPTKNLISLTRGDSYRPKQVRESIHSLLHPLGGMEEFVKKREKVLLKPNLLSAHPPASAVTTHPEVVKAVAREVIDAGGKPIVGDSPGHGSLHKVASVSGIRKACRQVDVPLVKFSEEVEVKTDNGVFKRFNVAKEVCEADKVINLAKFKTHSQMVLTLAVKNLFGVIIGGEKKRWHLKAGTNRMHFAHMLVDICNAVKPDLNIIDGIVGMEGDGPAHGRTIGLNLLMAGANPFAVDLVGTRVIGLNPDEYPVLKAAAKRGLLNKEEIEITGDLANLTINDFKLPASAEPPIPFVPDFLLPHIRKLVISKPVVNHKKCQQCGICVENCPVGTIEQADGRVNIDHGECINCFCCLELCPVGAIQIKEGILARFF